MLVYVGFFLLFLTGGGFTYDGFAPYGRDVPNSTGPANPKDGSSHAESYSLASASSSTYSDPKNNNSTGRFSSSSSSSSASSSSHTVNTSSDRDSKCPKNEYYVYNDEACLKTCGNRLLPPTDKSGVCQPYTGCVCDPGYFRKYDNATGPCITEDSCPPIPTNCGVNEEPTSCRIVCPPQSCESIFSLYLICPETECEPGCDCIDGYLRDSNGDCIPSEYCFEPNYPSSCNGDANATYVECGTACPLTCAEPDRTGKSCITVCVEGCQCNEGYILSERDGVCVLPQDCPGPSSCNGDANATYVECGTACPLTCAEPDRTGKSCIAVCVEGCQCNQDYILSERDGVCVLPQDCPGGSPDCGGNRTYVDCKVGCPTNYCPVDDNRGIVACSVPYPCPGGCACIGGYLQLSYDDPRCVLASDCPPVECTRQNEVFDRTPSNCYFERCEDRGLVCDSPYPGQPRCVCADGYFRNASDVCVPASECPPPGCNGDPNASLRSCPTPCPNTCAEPNRENGPCILICLPDGCVCNPGYVLSEELGICVKLEDCPEIGCNGDLNATHSDCPSSCPPTCANQNLGSSDNLCIDVCLPPGCVCKPGYIPTHLGGSCVLPEDCTKELGCNGDPNAEYKDCPSACQPTCDNPNTDGPCIAMCLPSGCVCKPGYILDKKDGKCIKIGDCPVKPGCNGDPNASLKQCPTPCPSTCAEPDRENGPCIEICLPDGCVCNPGYVLSEEGGVCVKREDCPVVDKGCNGDLNATLSDCPSACPPTCAGQNIGTSDSSCIDSCLPPGCVCKPGFILIDLDGPCVEPEDCPKELGCNGDPNAEHENCPSYCQPTCDKPNTDGPCADVCLPSGCVCKPGYILREINGKCIKIEHCPGKGCNGDPNASWTECRSACALTCAEPDAGRPCPAICLPSGCECNPGYVLAKDGLCILPEDCPAEPECNGDRNATFKECPSPCQPTCEEPDVDEACSDVCLPCGCVCKEGYLLDKTGKCVKPEDCPGGAPCCGKNETYVHCKIECPTNYCPDDDSLLQIICDPVYPCPGGCACKSGYLRIDYDNPICILASDCPPVQCTRPHEVYNPSPLSCYVDIRCENRDAICDFPFPIPPKCVCEDGYFRNLDDVCVHVSECPPLECNGDPNAIFSECPSNCPPDCEDLGPNQPCIKSCAEPGCVCKQNYARGPNGTCVWYEECPAPKSCNGDPNAIYSTCPSHCPAICNDNPDTACILSCAEPGCVCKKGYVRSEPNGICIKPSECPAPVKCAGPHEVYNPSPLSCYVDIPCENRDAICDFPFPIPPKCVCENGYFRNESGICVLPSECPPLDCNGDPNAIFSECPSNCPPDCEDLGPNQPCIESCAEPGCVCKQNYVLGPDGTCVWYEECPAPKTCNGDPNAVYSTCPSYCPLSCDNLNSNISCIQICAEPDCVCKQGYVLGPAGLCVLPSQCPALKSCNGDPNAVFSDCPSHCPSICNEPDKPCIRSCDEPGCVCKSGYILSEPNGTCVKPSECPPPESCNGDPNAIYSECPSECPATCNVPEKACVLSCDEPGCICKQGYILSAPNGTCVKPSECPCKNN